MADVLADRPTLVIEGAVNAADVVDAAFREETDRQLVQSAFEARRTIWQPYWARIPNDSLKNRFRRLAYRLISPF
jgi:hypothetical protein